MKLNKKQIIEFEDKLWNNQNEKNKYYFAFGKNSYSDEAYLINGYYINLNYYLGYWWLGIINTGEQNNLKFLLSFFKKLLKEKKKVAIWRTLDNKNLESIHNYACKFFRGRKANNGKISVVMFEEV